MRGKKRFIRKEKDTLYSGPSKTWNYFWRQERDIKQQRKIKRGKKRFNWKEKDIIYSSKTWNYFWRQDRDNNKQRERKRGKKRFIWKERYHIFGVWLIDFFLWTMIIILEDIIEMKIKGKRDREERRDF